MPINNVHSILSHTTTSYGKNECIYLNLLNRKNYRNSFEEVSKELKNYRISKELKKLSKFVRRSIERVKKTIETRRTNRKSIERVTT